MRFHYGSHPNPKELWQSTLENPPPVLAVDTETVSLKDLSAVGIGVAVSSQDAFYCTSDSQDFQILLNLLCEERVRKVFHNAPFDLRVLRPYDLDIFNIDDTAVLCRLNLEVDASLPNMSFWVDMQTESAKNFLARFNAKTMDEAPTAPLAEKCCRDSLATYRLWEYMQSRAPMAYYNKFERPLLPVLETISRKGIAIDQDRRQELEDYYAREVAYYRTVAEAEGFNPGSAYQVGFMLAKRKNFLPFTKSKRQFMTDNTTLSKLDDPLAQLVLMYRHTAKMLSTYLLPLQGMQRAYTTLSPDATTGRLTSTRMNLQNIPKRAEKGIAPTIRSMFIPDDGVFTLIDLSQIELRVLAYLSQDANMLAVFAQPDGDIHRDTEMRVWGTHGPNRLMAKVFNFAMIFGADPITISNQIGYKNVKQIADWMKLWMQGYPQAARWMLETQEIGLKQGYVETLYGRKMRLPIELIASGERGLKHLRNCTRSYPIQGTAAEIIKLVMLELNTAEFMPKMVLQIHDELMFNGTVKMPEGLEDLTPIHAPYEIKYVERWG